MGAADLQARQTMFSPSGLPVFTGGIGHRINGNMNLSQRGWSCGLVEVLWAPRGYLGGGYMHV